MSFFQQARRFGLKALDLGRISEPREHMTEKETSP